MAAIARTCHINNGTGSNGPLTDNDSDIIVSHGGSLIAKLHLLLNNFFF